MAKVALGRALRPSAQALLALLAAGLSGSSTAGKPHIVIIGGGWAGFGAAHALSRARLPLQVTLLEASPSLGGLAAGWQTPGGRPVEAGIHGFWRNYRNIHRVVAELELEPFTPYTPSDLYTRSGRAVRAPVLGKLPRVPAPLGPALWPRFETLSLLDQLTAAPLAGAFLDFDGSADAWARWDAMSAQELFAAAGVSWALYEEFLLPMLLVLPMCPGEECSAAAALSLFSFFALEHQADFDVRWLRASASESVFAPWQAALERAGVSVLPGKRVADVEVGEPTALEASKGLLPAGGGRRVTSVTCADGSCFRCDAVISAVGISAAQKIASTSPGLRALQGLAPAPAAATGAPHSTGGARRGGGGGDGRRGRACDFRALGALRAVDVVAVRLWLRRRMEPPCASNVCGGGLAAGLETTGFTFYNLIALQPQNFAQEAGSVIELDFYYCEKLLALGDRDVVRTALQALRRAAPDVYGTLGPRDVADAAVVRVPRAVSHFAPGCFDSLPGIESASLANWRWAGDWVDRGGHRSWSQEKALVTGMQAARSAADLVLGPDAGARVAAPLDVEADEPHVAAGRAAARFARGLFEGLSIRAV